VYDDVNADGVRDAGDTALAGVTVELLNGSGNPTGQTAITDANGNVSFSGFTPGNYEIAVVTPTGDVVSQATNVNTSNTLSGGATANATVGLYVAASTLIDTTSHGSESATGAGQVLVSQGVGQTLIGSSAGGDEFFGEGDTFITAQGSNNTIYVASGNHSIVMGANNNTATLNNGNDTVSATGTGNTVTGGNGNDTITKMTGSATITLGNGNDSIVITGANNNVTVGTGTDTISAGTGGGESVVAGDGANTISAGGTNDHITVGNGVNKISATGAAATIFAGNGGDTIAATGAGDHITTGSGNDTIQTTVGSDIIKAGLGFNTIRFAGSDNDVINQGGTDTLTDTGTDNTIVVPLAGQGLDTINGSVLTNGDTFDLRDVMSATTWDQQLSDLGDYLSLGTSGSNTLVQISVTSGGTPITVAVLHGQGSISLSSFVSHSLLT
jgi:Ca2+-binding RTX toxin-like protein